MGECVNDPEKRSNPVTKVGDKISGKADEERWRIYVTGHSMGGSKATLCAYELAVRPCAWPRNATANPQSSTFNVCLTRAAADA